MRRFRGLLDSMREAYAFCRMIFEADRPVDWIALEVNGAFARFTGLDDVVGKPVSEVMPSLRTDNPELFEAFGAVARTGESMQLETFVPGLGRWLRVSAFQPQPGCFVAVFDDATERKRIEQALRDSSLRYSALIDSSPDAIFLNRSDRIELANPAFLRMIGAASVDEVLGRSPFEFLHPDQHEEVRRRIHLMQASGRPAPRAEVRFLRADGTIVFAESVATHFRDEVGEAIQVVLRDVTERRQIEEQLRRQASLLQDAGEMAHVGGWEFDPRTGAGTWTEETARIHDLDPGVQPDVTRGLSLFEGESRQRIEAAVDAAIAEGKSYDLELELVTAKGVRKWVRTIGHPEVREGVVVLVRGSIQDISERKRAEQELANQHAHLRAVIDTIPDLVWLKDPEGVFLSCNPAFEGLTGVAEADLVGRTDFDFFPREVAEFFRQRDRDAIAAGGPSINEEWLTFADDGRRSLVETIKTPMVGSDGTVVGVLGIARDVTEERRTAEALRESEERLRLFIEHAPVALAMFDREMVYLAVSRRWRDDYGLGDRELLGHAHYEIFPEIGDAWKAVHRRALAGEVVREDDDRFERADGSVQWLRWEVRPWHDSQGAVAGIVMFTEDVTARKKAERRSATQAAVSRVLAERSSLADAAVPILAAIGESGGWDTGAFWSRQRDDQALVLAGQWSQGPASFDHLANATRRFVPRRGMGAVGAVWQSRQPILIPDVAKDDLFLRREAALADGLRSVAVFPITSGDEALGVLEFASRAIHESEPGLVEMFETIGRQLGQFAERRRAEEAVQRFFAGSPAVIYALRVREDGLSLNWFGGNLEAVCGWPASAVEGSAWWSDNLHPDDRERVLKASAIPYETDHQILEFRFRRPDQSWVWIRDEKQLLRDAAGRPSEVVGSWIDITTRVELEEQLRVSQKLEAVGRLAGGVAHDFNNLLTVISGNSEMLARALPDGGSEQVLLREIHAASERAAGLTRQLLAFGRSQVLAPRRLELNDAVRGIEGMLRRLIGEDVDFVSELSSDAGCIMVDPGQLEQVIVNLAVNARDAMPRGGRLTLATRAVELDAADCARLGDATPGPYAELVVRDTGTGIQPEVLPRIFEPFFTTKGPAKGSGLGLSTVFGIVKQSGGQIQVESELGAGTTFTISLPRLAGRSASPAPEPAPPTPATPGQERILLVEDEEGVRKVAQIAIESRGYTVLVASDGREALAMAEQATPPVDLVLTDLVMPDMSGRQLAERLRARWPDLRILFMSGYVGDALERHGLVASEEAFLQKPFSLKDLTGKVRAVLDGDGKPGGGRSAG